MDWPQSRLRLFLLVIVIAVINHASADMDYTYSVADLYRLLQTEHRLSTILKEVENSVTDFNKILEDCQKAKLHEYSSDTITKSPILSYQLIKRHARDLEKLDKFFNEFMVKVTELKTSYSKIRLFAKPGERDLEQAMEAIIRLRQTYNLSVDEFSQGRIGNFQAAGVLSPTDLASIGIFAKGNEMNVNARLFLETAVNNYNNRTNPDSSRPVDDNDNWKEDVERKLDILRQNVTDKPDREDFKLLTDIDVVFQTDTLDNLNSAFENLCQIHATKEAPISNLKCYLDSHSEPTRRLSPLKLEVFHENPQVVVIYDFMTESEIQDIDSATFHKFKRSQIQIFEDGIFTSEPSVIRTTSQTWIFDRGHTQFGYLSKRIEAVTGYHLSGEFSAEDLQVANYRPGGHYSLHTDALHEKMFQEYLQPIDILQGDRLATFMLYLTDVEMGGNTVFPMLNVSVRPVKGSAILWGNLNIDGSIARSTLHGACPVLYGVKTIATKWIRANDQMFTRHKCKPDRNSNHYKLH